MRRVLGTWDREKVDQKKTERNYNILIITGAQHPRTIIIENPFPFFQFAC